MKKLISVLIFILMLSLTNVSFITVGNESNLNDTIYVDDDGTSDYTSIQEAINNASDGDTVFVFDGFYNEKIKIDKSVELIGQDKLNTIIDGKIFIFNTSSVIISNFTIQNGSDGIEFARSSDVLIKNNFITNTNYGIVIRWNSTNACVCNNEIINNKHGGILTEYYASIYQNNFIDNGINARILYSHCYLRDNYWDDWIGLKLPFLIFLPYYIRTVLGFPNFDWHPAKEPYDITMS